MQDNYEEDLSEKEKAIVREMCNVRTPSNSWGSFWGLLLEVWRNRDLLHVRIMRSPGTRKSGGSADHCSG